ncbi:MAG: AlkZ family DNA glycosylase [Alphaproteobacteria bacterium]|nr:AlkZ family DNA glycosylase [Alphaproteobacteria bacterium]MCB9791306.1 AlkZ family DNA glycosylase [Alphaproteobacteria bacterium]
MLTTETRRARLMARHHLSRGAGEVLHAVRDLVTVHSSDPLTPHLALWARVPGYRTEHLEAHIAEGRLWRLHAMRRTLWIGLREEVAALDAAVGAPVAQKERARLLGWVQQDRSDAEAWLAGLEALALEAVQREPGVTTRALTATLPELAARIRVGSGKWTTEVAVGSRLLVLMAMELKLARAAPIGSWKSSQYGWFLPEALPALAPAEARAALVARYLQRFGPVTELDVKWWTGLTVAATRKALKAAGAVPVQLAEGPGWDHPEADAAEAGGVALLPGLDPTPMGWKERAWFLGPHEAQLFDRNGNVGPSVWVDGRIVGGWAAPEGEVRLALLEDLSASERAQVEQEAHDLTAWLEGVGIKPRFPTPIDQSLS